MGDIEQEYYDNPIKGWIGVGQVKRETGHRPVSTTYRGPAKTVRAIPEAAGGFREISKKTLRSRPTLRSLR